MKTAFKNILLTATLAAASACSFLDPLPNGEYTDENYNKYPSIIRGFIDEAYELLPSTYISDEFAGLDCASDDCVYTSRNEQMRLLSIGDGKPSSYPLENYWERDYKGIFYVNYFLKDNIGPTTRYLTDPEHNKKLQNLLTGDAYALRAWYLFDLLKKFAGEGTDGKLLGVPVFTSFFEFNEKTMAGVQRASYDECMEQIVSDCNEALKHLPLGNRDFLVTLDNSQLEGAIRYGCFDQIAVKALLAHVYLTWASPAFNPSGDKTRWEKAASYAKDVIRHKLDVESTQTGGFNPQSPFYWTNPNDPEIILCSEYASSTKYETGFYPLGFGGKATLSPTQEFVDAFPDSNGYPIDHRLSIYDKDNPYANRDPRFYANVFYNGSKVCRNDSPSDVMYTINTAEGGDDAPGLAQTSLTGYYAKKFIFSGWNSYDKTVQTGVHSIFFLRWSQMCLIFAEAANHCVGATDKSKFGLSAKEALGYIRSRSCVGGTKGVGADADPYLDECASAGEKAFDDLVRNEWRIETFLEGTRFFNLRRWGASAAQLSVPVHGVSISAAGEFKNVIIETRKFTSPWLPIPYLDIRKSPKMVQNKGWEGWK